MTWFKIISLEEFESCYGTVKIGEEINAVNMEDINECKKWVHKQYGPSGEDIKVKIVEVKE